jgi:hypothetical protein
MKTSALNVIPAGRGAFELVAQGLTIAILLFDVDVARRDAGFTRVVSASAVRPTTVASHAGTFARDRSSENGARLSSAIKEPCPREIGSSRSIAIAAAGHHPPATASGVEARGFIMPCGKPIVKGPVPSSDDRTPTPRRDARRARPSVEIGILGPTRA